MKKVYVERGYLHEKDWTGRHFIREATREEKALAIYIAGLETYISTLQHLLVRADEWSALAADMVARICEPSAASANDD
jgi:hypothetical protein